MTIGNIIFLILGLLAIAGYAIVRWNLLGESGLLRMIFFIAFLLIIVIRYAFSGIIPAESVGKWDTALFISYGGLGICIVVAIIRGIFG